MKGISVIICCYNSASRLPNTLKHLAEQKGTADLKCEIIVVDNASTDETVAVAQQEWNKYNADIPFKIIHEATPGLSSARQAGVRNSKFDYFLFCDDDNWLDPNFIKNAYQLMEEKPEVGALGGQCTPTSDIPLPDWFDQYAENYAVGKQADRTGDISARKFVWGAALVLRKTVFEEAYKKFDSLLSDRKGASLSSGGDTEICMRILLAGYRLYYAEHLTFVHYIPPARLTTDYRDRLLAGLNATGLIFYFYSTMIELVSLSKRKRYKALLKNMSNIVKLKVSKTKELSPSHEALVFFYLTGVQLVKVNPDAIVVKKVADGLKTTRQLITS